MEMKCLSLKQPFADLVVEGKKTIELRGWNTSFRGTFLVQASGNLDYEACKAFGLDPGSLVRRAVVGKATIYDVKEYNSTEEFMKDRDKHLATEKYADPKYSKYGFLLRDAVKFEKAIPMPGRLGFFDVELTVP